MRLPMMARSSSIRFTMALASAVMISACSADVMTPSASKTEERVSAFAPTPASLALIGVADGTYTVTFDPTHDQSFSLGPNRLDMPAHSVCNLTTSGYGTAYWNKPCSAQVLPVTLSVTIKNSQSAHPSIQFFPAMRFNPATSVQLFMYAPHVSQLDAKNWLMFYCNDAKVCVDESLTDAALRTYVDYSTSVVFRRVKHFSGYVVAERDGLSDGGQ